MSTRLVACTSCGRHVFASEPKCPFCDSKLTRAVLASVVSLTLLGCPDKQMKPDDASASAPSSASASASALASAPASASASASANPDAGPDLSVLAGGSLTGDGGPLGLRLGGGVYGPATNTTATGGLASIGLRGECILSAVKATVPVSDAERVMAGMRPRFRAAFNSGLQKDPSIEGKLEYEATIAPNGSVQSVNTKATGGLPSEVVANMKSIISRAQFASPEKPSVLTGTITCKKTETQ